MRGFVLAALIAVTLPAGAQLRIVTWNTAGEPRTGADTVLEAIGNESVSGIAKPIDALLLQEQNSVTGDTQDFVDLLNGIYGAGTYARGLFNPGSTGGGRVAIVYNTSTLDLIAETAINTESTSGAARQVMRYTLRPDGYGPDADFYIYNSHYKASTGSTNQARRLIEATDIRDDADALGQGAHAIYLGDFNMRSSSESAYQELLSPGNGQAFDPINRPGSWNNDAGFLDVHTQSPVTSSRFGGQITGGMDDRFDQQLVTGELLDGEGLDYIPGSYRAFGNNGTHTFNGEITSGTGASAAVLNALAETSDHLPVVADYQVPAVMTVIVDETPTIVRQGESVPFTVSIRNTADVVRFNGADELDYVYTTTGALIGNGSGSTPARGSTGHLAGLDTRFLGPQVGEVNVTATSPGTANASFVEQIQFTVVHPADLDLDGDVDDADFGIAFAAFSGPGNPTGNPTTDLDGDGDTDDADFGIAFAAFTGPGTPANVPEPATLLLVGVGGLCITRRR